MYQPRDPRLRDQDNNNGSASGGTNTPTNIDDAQSIRFKTEDNIVNNNNNNSDGNSGGGSGDIQQQQNQYQYNAQQQQPQQQSGSSGGYIQSPQQQQQQPNQQQYQYPQQQPQAGGYFVQLNQQQQQQQPNQQPQDYIQQNQNQQQPNQQYQYPQQQQQQQQPNQPQQQQQQVGYYAQPNQQQGGGYYGQPNQQQQQPNQQPQDYIQSNQQQQSQPQQQYQYPQPQGYAQTPQNQQQQQQPQQYQYPQQQAGYVPQNQQQGGFYGSQQQAGYVQTPQNQQQGGGFYPNQPNQQQTPYGGIPQNIQQQQQPQDLQYQGGYPPQNIQQPQPQPQQQPIGFVAPQGVYAPQPQQQPIVYALQSSPHIPFDPQQQPQQQVIYGQQQPPITMPQQQQSIYAPQQPNQPQQYQYIPQQQGGVYYAQQPNQQQPNQQQPNQQPQLQPQQPIQYPTPYGQPQQQVYPTPPTPYGQPQPQPQQYPQPQQPQQQYTQPQQYPQQQQTQPQQQPQTQQPQPQQNQTPSNQRQPETNDNWRNIVDSSFKVNQERFDSGILENKPESLKRESSDRIEQRDPREFKRRELDRDIERDRDRDRSRTRGRDRSRSRSRDNFRYRSRSRSLDRRRDRDRSMDRIRGGGRDRDRSRSRSIGRDRDRGGRESMGRESMGRDRDRDWGRGGGGRDRSIDRDRDRGGRESMGRDRDRSNRISYGRDNNNNNSPPIIYTETANDSITNRRNRIRVRDEDVIGINDGNKKLATSGNSIFSKSVNLVSNQFLLNIDKSVKIWIYNVTFNPPILNRVKKFKILSSLTKEIGINIFDGLDLLYCLNENDNEQNYIYSEDNSISVKITMLKELDSLSTMKFYNTFMRRVMRLMGYSIVGRQYYNSQLSQRIEGSSLNVWSGFHTSVNKISSGVALLADMSRKIIRKESVLGIFGNSNRNSSDRIAIERRLIGSIVITLYNNKTYRINSIDWNKSPKSTFFTTPPPTTTTTISTTAQPINNNNNNTDTTTGGTEITFEKYYKLQYNRTISDLNQPLIITKCRGRSEEIYLIPEFCYLIGVTFEDKINNSRMRDIQQHTLVEPKKRFDGLTEFVESINKDSAIKQEIKHWGISFEKSLELTGNIFNSPHKDIRSSSRIKGSWGIIATRYCDKEIDIIEGEMSRHCEERPYIRSIDHNDRRDFTNAMKDIQDSCSSKSYLDFIICIIPNFQTDLYNSIKKTAILDCKIITQVITAKIIGGPKFKTIFPKLLSQINTKIGMAPFRLSRPVPGIPKSIMIVGIDVCRTQQRDGGSVAAFCATTNSEFTDVYVSTTFQRESTKETISSLGQSMANALRAYHKLNSSLPETVIIYRDSVSDGMIDAVNTFEVQSIRDSFSQLPPSMGQKPKLIFIIVKKNTHLRFFEPYRDYGNPDQGVVITQSVTRDRWYDFFLISQKTIKGTSNPTHYHVIQDETTIQPEALQQLTYNLCHLYFGSDFSVSVPSVCQFSHKASTLVSKSCNANSPENLSDRLFFL